MYSCACSSEFSVTSCLQGSRWALRDASQRYAPKAVTKGKEYYIKCVRHPGGTSQPIQLARIGCHRESRETAASACGVRRQAQLLRCASHLLVPNPRRGAAAHIVLCSRHLAEAPLEKA